MAPYLFIFTIKMNILFNSVLDPMNVNIGAKMNDLCIFVCLNHCKMNKVNQKASYTKCVHWSILTHHPPMPVLEYSDSILVTCNINDLFTNTCSEMACIRTCFTWNISHTVFCPTSKTKTTRNHWSWYRPIVGLLVNWARIWRELRLLCKKLKRYPYTVKCQGNQTWCNHISRDPANS